MFINLYIARPIYHFILIYTCGLTVVIKRICYVMLPPYLYRHDTLPYTSAIVLLGIDIATYV